MWQDGSFQVSRDCEVIYKRFSEVKPGESHLHSKLGRSKKHEYELTR